MNIPEPMPYPGHNGWPSDGCQSVLTQWLDGGRSIRLSFSSDDEAMRFAEHQAGHSLAWQWYTNEGGLTYGHAKCDQISDPWNV